MNQNAPVLAAAPHHHDAEYHAYINRMAAHFRRASEDGTRPLFTTRTVGMWERYLNSFTDPAERQYHNCNACRRFIERYGGLVTIDKNGGTESAVWNLMEVPERYKAAVFGMGDHVQHAQISGVFITDEQALGTRTTGPWEHFAIEVPEALIHDNQNPLTPGQVAAEKAHDFRILMVALQQIRREHVEAAVTLLGSESLSRSEKVLGQAVFLDRLMFLRERVSGLARTNLVWRAVATAPEGFCHVRGNMIGTLLEDIAAGKPFDQIARAFNAKMDPMQYQRPQAAPSAGAISAAERLMEKMGAAGSLDRRFARMDEVVAVWRPPVKEEEAPAGGVFGHLKPKGAVEVHLDLPPQRVTWEKFQRKILPEVVRIQVQAPNVGPYCALLTAADPEAPPILQWDSPEKRNPVSWYQYHRGSHAQHFNLRGGAWYDVPVVTMAPWMWSGAFEHMGEAVLLLIEEARETQRSGNGLFPETLRSEFHGIRAVIEAYSRGALVGGFGEPHAAGIALTKGNQWGAVIRVWSEGSTIPVPYVLERWD
jgi:hypothetical protein